MNSVVINSAHIERGTITSMNTPKALLLTSEHKETLEKLVKSGMTPAIIIQRAKILLFKAAGRTNESVADELGINKRTVLL